MHTVGSDSRPEYYRQGAAAVLEALHSHKMGLTNTEAERRHKDMGANVLPALATRSAAGQCIRAAIHPLILGSIICILLVIASGQYGLAFSLLLIVVVNIALRAALFVAQTPTTKLPELPGHAHIIRNGQSKRIETARLAIGDLVQLGADTVVPADIRLLNAEKLVIDESTLFATNSNVSKSVAALKAPLPLSERSNMAWAGSRVIAGNAAGIVTAIGAQTELGRIILLANTADDSKPVARHWSRAWLVATGMLVLLPAIGWFMGANATNILAGLALLSVALLPLGICLAQVVGLWRMRPRSGINLGVLERLGAVDTLLTSEKAIHRFKPFGLHILHIGQGKSALALNRLDDQQLIQQLQHGSAVFGELAPEEKLRLVRAAQASGRHVAVLGSDLSDLAARIQADVGIAARNDLAAVLTQAHAAKALLAHIRQTAAYLSALTALLTLYGIIGLWQLHIPLPLNAWLIIVGQVLVWPLLISCLHARQLAVTTSTLFTRAGVAATAAYVVFLLYFGVHSVDPAYIDPANHLVRAAVTISFSTIALCLLADVLLRARRFTQTSLLLCLGITFMLLNISYNPWLQTLFGTTELGLTDWLLAAAAVIAYMLFAMLQSHSQHHSRSAIIELHRAHASKLI